MSTEKKISYFTAVDLDFNPTKNGDNDTQPWLSFDADTMSAILKRSGGQNPFTAEDAPGMPGASGAVPARGSRPRAGGGDAERSRPLTRNKSRVFLRRVRRVSFAEISNEFSTRGRLLIYGDNTQIIRKLLQLQLFKESAKLVYIDPPFGTRQAFTIDPERANAVSRVDDAFIAYQDNLFGNQYLAFLRERLGLIRELMAPDGSIYIHIDTKVGHYVKCLMDKIFGAENFVNDITRIKCNPKNFARMGYGNIKDMVLFYAKSKKFVWNEPRQSIVIDKGDARFNLVDENGRQFTTTPLHAPGETKNGVTGKKWRGMLPPKGRHWRYPPTVLDDLNRKGLVHWSANGNPRKKIYADEVMRAGIKVQDVWSFKDPQNPRYPTEKNLTMLEMIIQASSFKSDIVLDAFCGSGSTLQAAEKFGRRWIGIDSSIHAIHIAAQRLDCEAFEIL